MMVDYSAHPQHMNVLNHLEYVWRRCENHLMWVWSLNHCNLPLLQFQVRTGNFAVTQIYANKGYDNDMMMNPSAHTQHMNDLKHFLYA
jgi:hypothetical protein